MIPDTAIIIGPVPPPYHGVTVYMNNIINSDLLRKKFNIIHLDTSDHRDLKNLGMFDFKNIYLAILQSVKYFVLLLRTKPHLVYIPISQNYGGYLRDGLFIILTYPI